MIHFIKLIEFRQCQIQKIVFNRYESSEYSNPPAELNSIGTSYADNLTDLLNSLEAIKVNESSSSAKKGKAPMIEPDLKWISDLLDSVD